MFHPYLQEEILTKEMKGIEENFKWRAHGMDWKQTNGVGQSQGSG